MFSGFLSVNTYAYEYYNNIPVRSPLVMNRLHASGTTGTHSANVGNGNIYSFSNGQYSDIVSLGFGTSTPYTILPVNIDLYDYYFVASLYSYNEYEWTFFPDTFNISVFDDDRDWGAAYNIPVSDLRWYDAFGHQGQGVALSCKIDFTDSVVPYYFEFANSDGSGTRVTNGVQFQASFIEVPKDNSEAATNAIISAINNQTNSLNGSIGQATDDIQSSIDQATDDIQQSIEDQYSGDPMEEISGPFYEALEEYQETIGVFDYSMELVQFLMNLFISFDSQGSQPVLTFPGFSIDVGDETFVVWPDYSFNFNELMSEFPVFFNSLHFITNALLWLAVLNYAMKVFRRRFTSEG